MFEYVAFVYLDIGDAFFCKLLCEGCAKLFVFFNGYDFFYTRSEGSSKRSCPRAYFKNRVRRNKARGVNNGVQRPLAGKKVLA